jgi:hypothetical protein
MARLARALTVASAVVGLGALAGCGSNGGLDLARQACTHVDASLREYNASLHAKSQAQATLDLARADAQLREALPLAASATSSDGQWNALMTTISESARVNESELASALKAQCAVATSGGPAVP